MLKYTRYLYTSIIITAAPTPEIFLYENYMCLLYDGKYGKYCVKHARAHQDQRITATIQEEKKSTELISKHKSTYRTIK